MPSAKRARKSSSASSRRVKPKTRNSLRQGESSTSPQEHKSYLEKLPSEIISEIWKHSREPSLIHTCRRLYETLPSWTHVTKCMATLAIIAAPTEDKDLETILHDLLVPIPGIEKPYDEGVREVLQGEVFTSSWFQRHHLPKTIKLVYTRAIRFELFSSTYFEGAFTLSKGQQKKLDKFLSKADPYNGRVKFKLRASCPAGPLMTIEVRHNHMLFSARDGPQIVIPITEVAKIPDSLLEVPMTREKKDRIDMMMSANDFWTSLDLHSHDVSPKLTCSQERLRAAICNIITQPWSPEDDEALHQLFDVDSECFKWQDLDSTLDFDVLKLAASSDASPYVYHLLEEMRQSTDDVTDIFGLSQFQWEPTTEQLEQLSQHLLEVKPTSKSRDLIEMELESRQLMEEAASPPQNGLARRSAQCPFVIDTFVRGESKRVAPDGFYKRMCRAEVVVYQEEEEDDDDE